MTKRQLLYFFFKWKVSIFSLFLLIVSLVTLFVYLLPPNYTGKTKLLVERNRSPVMRSDLSVGLEMAEVTNTEIEIILSRTVIASVVDKLKPFNRPPKEATYISDVVEKFKSKLEELGLTIHMEPRDRWIKYLLDHVNVEPVVNSTILEIIYKDQSPEWAAKIANSITDAYIEHHFKIYSPIVSVKLYKQRMEDIVKTLNRKRQEMEEFKKKISASAIEESKRGIVQSIGSLRVQLTEYRVTLSDLLTRFEPGHKEIKRLNSNISQITSSISEANKQLNDLEIQRDKIKKMDKEIVSEEKTYESYKNKYEESYITEVGNVELINVRVVDYSPVPVRPEYSNLFLIALSVVAGIIISVAIAFIREYFDHQVTDPGDVEQILGIPELGSIKKFGMLSKALKYPIR